MLKVQSLVVVILCLFATNTVAGENDLYDFQWLDPDKSVFVLQNKIYPKNKSLYFDLGYISNITSTFQETNGAQFKFGYFFTEEWAVEFNYLQYSNTDNANFDSVQEIASLAPFVIRPLSSTSVFAIWSPFYGKINTFNEIYYFDVAVGIGTGTFVAESNIGSAGDASKNIYESESYTPIQFKLNTKLHISKQMHIGIEYLNTNFEANTDFNNPNQKKWKSNNDLIFSFGVSF